MNAWLSKLVTLLAGLLPAAAWAADSEADSVWTIYAPAAGSAIYEVLVGISMMLERDGGGVVGVMLTLALLGIIATAARIGTAGMAVSQFLTYLLSVWVVSVTTFSIKVPVVVADRTANYYMAVERVPILFAAPAALVSQAGAMITEKIETFLSLPEQLKMTGARQFNLLGKVMADGDSLRITNPALKTSVSNYIADCAVPGMATNVISLTTLRTTSDIWGALKYDNLGVLTRYRPYSPTTKLDGQGSDGVALVSCSEAHGLIEKDLETHAEEFAANGDLGDLAASGVMAPLGEAMTSAHMWLAGTNGASMSGASYLRQRIMANSMNGSFRDAAAQAGNNELMTAAAITQAEEAQKSTWVAGAAIFNDLMGYIYIVSQVIIYGMAPIVAMLLFAPGFGFRGALSYLQVMIWLALWEPLLALVNFTVALFAKNSIGDMIVTSGGYTLASTPVISEQTNNLMMAAGFMGSMVPVLAWNIAKGSISLMDFVGAAGGGQGASQAGSTATTGNMSFDNVSMGARTMNKADMTSSLAVGHAGVISSNTALGALTDKVDAGGRVTTANGQQQKIDSTRQSSVQESASVQHSTALASQASALTSQQDAVSSKLSGMRTATSGTSSSHSVAGTVSQADRESMGRSTGETIGKSYAVGYEQVSQTANQLAYALNAAAGLNAGGPFDYKAIQQKAAGTKDPAQKAALTAGLDAMKSLVSSGGGMARALGTYGGAATGVLGTLGTMAGLALPLGAAAAPLAAGAAVAAAAGAIAGLGNVARAGGGVSQQDSATLSDAEKVSSQNSVAMQQQMTKLDDFVKSNGITVTDTSTATGTSGFSMSIGGEQIQMGAHVQSAGASMSSQLNQQYQHLRSQSQTQSITTTTSADLNQLRLGGAAITPSLGGDAPVLGGPSISASALNAVGDARSTMATGTAQAQGYGGQASRESAAIAANVGADNAETSVRLTGSQGRLTQDTATVASEVPRPGATPTLTRRDPKGESPIPGAIEANRPK